MNNPINKNKFLRNETQMYRTAWHYKQHIAVQSASVKKVLLCILK